MSACLRCLLSSRTSRNWKRQFCKEKVHCLPRYSLLLDYFSLPSSAALSPFGKVLAGWMLLSVISKIVYRIPGVSNSTVGRQKGDNRNNYNLMTQGTASLSPKCRRSVHRLYSQLVLRAYLSSTSAGEGKAAQGVCGDAYDVSALLPVPTPSPCLSLPILVKEQCGTSWGMAEEEAAVRYFTLIIKATLLCVLARNLWFCFETLLTPFGNTFLGQATATPAQRAKSVKRWCFPKALIIKATWSAG